MYARAIRAVACGAALLALSTAWVATTQAATLRVHYDTGWGKNIAIRGNAASLSWYSGKQATWTTGNVWVYQTPTADGGFQFKPLINDSSWSVGANYVVPGGSSVVDIYPFFGNQNGTLTTISNFHSNILGNNRNLIIYLPPSYSENPLKYYQVVYMHDGQNLFNAATAFGGVEWQVDETLNSKIRQGTVREVIVVGINNNASRISEYTPMPDPDYGGGNGDAYLDFIQYEVMPYINSSFRVLTGPTNTFIGGSSLGGLISFYASWTRSNVFGHAICMSSSFWWNNEALTHQVQADTGPIDLNRFYLDSGGINDGAAQTNTMRDSLAARGYTFNVNLFHWYDPQGSHNEASWQRRFYIPMEKLLPFQ